MLLLSPGGACPGPSPRPSKQPCHQGVVLDTGWGRWWWCHIHPHATKLACKWLFQHFAAALRKTQKNWQFPALLSQGKASSPMCLGPNCGTRGAACVAGGGGDCLAGRTSRILSWDSLLLQRSHPGFPGSAPTPVTKLPGAFALTPQQRAGLAHQPVAGAMRPHKTPSGSIPLGEILLHPLPADPA